MRVTVIRVTPREAPSKSWGFAKESAKLQREMYAHGRGAFSALVLALYHPRTFEVFDEHVLSPGPAQHPLASHPVWKNSPWPSTSGTVTLADQMGMLTKHPAEIVRSTSRPSAEIPDESETKEWQVIPYVGDYLLFLNDEQGPYVVDWDVKDKPGRHGKPGPGSFQKQHSARSVKQAEFRDQIYQAYMSELGIRIARIAGSDIDEQVAANLKRLFNLHTRPINLPVTMVSDLIHAFRESITTGDTPVDVTNRYVSKAVPRPVIKDVLEQAIWYRKVRVDLFRPILVDRPLRPESRDVVDVYASWFAR